MFFFGRIFSRCATLLLLLLTVPTLAYSEPPLRIEVLTPGEPLKPGKQYVMTITCWIRHEDKSRFETYLGWYMAGVNAQGDYSSRHRSPRTGILHSVIVSQGQPVGTNLTSSAPSVFTLPEQTLSLPIFYGTRTIGNRMVPPKMTYSYDGTRACPDKILLAGDNNTFLTPFFHHTNKTDQTHPTSDIAKFIAGNLPGFRYALLNDISSDEQKAKLKEVEPLSKAVEKLVNGWRTETTLMPPQRLETGKIQILNPLTTVEIAVTEVGSFLESDPDLAPLIVEMIPGSVTEPKGEAENFRQACIAWTNALADVGLTSEVDQAFLVVRKMQRDSRNREDIVRCLGVGRLTDAATGPSAALVAPDERWRVTKEDVAVFSNNFPDEVLKTVIENTAASKADAELRSRIVRDTYEIYLHRVRRADTQDDLQPWVLEALLRDFAPLLEIADRTRLGDFADRVPERASPFVAMKSLGAAGLSVWGCGLTPVPANAGLPSDLGALPFIGFSPTEGDPKKLKRENGYVFWPGFDNSNRLARLTIRDQDVDNLLNAHAACKGRLVD